jgi:hypothetical protein
VTDRERVTAALADRYRVEREIGVGGMATVYLAHELATGHRVAIKVLRSDLVAMLGTERFLREVQIASQLDHPHVVGFLDSGTVPAASGESQGTLYYVMPYIDGGSLRDRMTQEQQLPLDVTLDIASQVAEVLDYANGRGLVHRDIKPENILLSGSQVFVTDFGIARAIDTAGGARLTETGLTLGTPAYMSPEQSLSETVDARTDVYALGCVVYEMLVGEPPYTGPTAQAIIARRLSEQLPSLRVVRDALPRSVESAVHRALARTPADRYATAGEFVTALKAPSPAAAVPSRRPVGALAAAALAVALVAGWYLRRSAPVDSARVIAILPFASAPETDTALQQLGRALVSTLGADLGQVSGIRTVNVDKTMGTSSDAALAAYGPAAIALGRRAGAHSVLFGNLRGMGQGKVQIDLRLLAADSSSDTLAVASATGSVDSISALTDSLTLRVLRQVWRHGTAPSASLASITTGSIPALTAFLQGERLALAGRWADAALSYDAAFRLDTTFWLAAWRHNEAQSWIPGEPDLDDTLQHKVEAHRASFGERDRLLIGGEATSATEPYAAHLERFRDISQHFATDWAAIWPYADHLVHGGPLIGRTGAEMRAALERTVALNPKLTNAWEHLYFASVGRDSAVTDQSLRALIALGDTIPPFGTSPILARLAATTDGDPPQVAFDSAATLVRRSVQKGLAFSGLLLLAGGYPGRQLTLARMMLHDAPRDSATLVAIWQSMAVAWGGRGVWDSALVAADRVAAFSAGAMPIEAYRYAVIGAWLGGLPVQIAVARHETVVRYLASHTDDPGSKRARARLIWCDALLAILQSDTAALATQRKALQALDDHSSAAVATDRTFAAFQLLLRNKKNAAADSLAAIDLGATETDLLQREPLARAVGHLTGAQLALQLRDTVRALRLLTWPEADIGDPVTSAWFAPASELWIARIADAQHRKADAIYHYRQFLQRYDVATPATRPLIEEARRALTRLFGLADPSRAP